MLAGREPPWLATGAHKLGVVKPAAGARALGGCSVYSPRPHRVPDAARGIHVARAVVYVLAHQGVEGVMAVAAGDDGG